MLLYSIYSISFYPTLSILSHSILLNCTLFYSNLLYSITLYCTLPYLSSKGVYRLDITPTLGRQPSILLRKQGKPMYTAAKAYRVISLLSCLGKVVERVVATWVASFCETNGVCHRGQFGCRQGRGTSDVVAHLVTKVENA
jgi:hypothetical protein